MSIWSTRCHFINYKIYFKLKNKIEFLTFNILRKTKVNMNADQIFLYINNVKDSLNKNLEICSVLTSIFIFYYFPYMFFSIVFIFTLYGIYTNIIADLQFDIKINTVRKFKNKRLSTIDFDKPIEADKME